jgi:hypothetical protein
MAKLQQRFYRSSRVKMSYTTVRFNTVTKLMQLVTRAPLDSSCGCVVLCYMYTAKKTFFQAYINPLKTKRVCFI